MKKDTKGGKLTFYDLIDSQCFAFCKYSVKQSAKFTCVCVPRAEWIVGSCLKLCQDADVKNKKC